MHGRGQIYHPYRDVLVPCLPLRLLLCLFILIVTSTTHAIISDDESQRPPPNDPDYAAGLVAYKQEDWHAVIDHMTNVITQRPWRDNAHNLLGFAYRKLGQYRRAIAHYRKALELNPYHRGALEYLGEAYAELGCLGLADAMLARLEATCRRVAPDDAKPDWQSHCEEWQELRTVIAARRQQTTANCSFD